MEPMSCAAKAVQQAYEVQRRMKVWQPETAFVMGAGQIGLLATLILTLRGLDVYTLARSEPPTHNADIVEAIHAHYVSTTQTSLQELAERVGKADLIIDATGSSTMAFEGMKVLGHNGVLVWTSITAGERSMEIASDQINMDWVLGNKLLLGSVNANRRHFESGIQDLALAEVSYPGAVEKILTHPVDGLDQHREMMRLLVEEKSALKVYVNVAEL
jgi:threonine dehydrogenase-like Zn-dependent dehydrogenase